MKHYQLVPIGILVALCWYLGVYLAQYDDCRLHARKWYFLFTSTEERREACKKKLNPFDY